ncbi:hypothetical protein FRC10_010936 [Ceratobasidium sp. 414]|nr:hypothetical protein FRC10_010936 [Ceratobasidium sp. 414]
MSGGSVPSLFGYYPHTLPHSRVSHSDPSYTPSSSYLNSNNYSGSLSTGGGNGGTTTSSYANASTSHVQAEHPVGATGTSTPSDPAASGGDSLAGSGKRPFPFPLGSQERDKRARSCEGQNASGSGMVRNGSGMWEGAGGTWTQEQAVPGEGSGSGSGRDATIAGDDEDVRVDEEADVDSSIGEAQIDEDEVPNQETSSYASAAESPQPTQFSPRSPVVIETPWQSNTIPFSAASTYARSSPYGVGPFPIDATSSSYPMEPMASTTHNRGTSPAPRIPTPAALRSSSPLDLSILSGSTSIPTVPAFPNVNTQPTSSSGTRDTHPAARLPPLRSQSSPGLDRLPPLSMHALTGREIDSPSEPESAMRPRPGLFDMGWMTQQYDQILESQGSEPVAPTTLEVATFRSRSQAERPGASHSRSDSGNVERSGRALRALPVTRRVRSPPPTLGSTRDLTVNTAVNFGSSSVDSALPASAFGERRMPLPQVDFEQDWMIGSASSGFAGAASSRAIESTSSVVGSDGAESPFGSALSPGLGESLSPIVNGPASPPFGGLASPMGGESVASTVQSEDEPNSGSAARRNNTILPNERPSVHTEVTTAGGHSALATFVSPTSGGSASIRTTPSGYTRRPPSLSLRGFPTSPTFSSMSGPVSASPSFVLPESPIFPVSASPRTSTFDLAVTPPGSALPSFVARMMEVDSPVRESAEGLGHAYTIPELVLEPRAENDAASIDALRRFARGAGGASPDDAPTGSYFTESPDPEVRREPIRFPLSALESPRTTEGLSARALREFDESDGMVEQAPLFPPPREGSQVAQQGSSTFSQPSSSAFAQSSSSTFSTGTDSTAHQLGGSSLVWSSRPPDLGSTHLQRLAESGVSYPSRPSASDTSFPSFRANVSPGPELNMGSRPGRLVRDMSWSFSDVFQPPGHEGSMEALSGSGSETNLRPHEHDERIEGDNRGTRAGVRNALTRAARLAGPARGNESLPRLHLNALPRVSGAESSTTQDEQSRSWSAMTASTNLSRTPPGVGPSESDIPSFAEAWLEEGSRSTRPPPPRRMSGPRWMDLFSETSAQPVAVPTAQRPSNRPRMPPAIPMSSADSTLFDPLSGMNWPSDAHPPQAPPLEPQAPRAETRQEFAQDSLARYQTFAQSIDELRRSPAHLQQAPNASPNLWNSNGATGLRLPPVIAPSTSTAFPPTRTESTGLSGISTWFGDGSGNSRPPWAMPRHEPLPMLDEPRRPYDHDIHPPAPPPEPARGPPPQPQERGSNWLREWERERDRQSRLAREDYWRSRETEPAGAAVTSAGPSSLEQRRRATSIHRPPAQLSETQAQGRMWDEYNTRHEPRPWPTMTRSSLAATGFPDDDLSNEWANDGNTMDLWGNMPRRPPRRQEVLPPRSSDAGAPAQSSEATANRISDLPFTESPPSLLQELIDMGRSDHYNDSFSSDVFQSFQRTNSQQAVPGSNPPDFRHAGDMLRRSLANTSPRTSRERDSPNRTGQARSPPSRRFLGLGETPVQSQPGNSTSQTERSRLSFPRDRRDMLQLARSQSQMDRMRQLLQSRSGDSRDPSRRRLTDLGRSPATQTSRRRSFMSALETEPVSPTSLEPARGAQWPRDPEMQSERQPSLRHDDHSSWSSTESPRNNLQELLRAASRVRRRRTLLPESASRRAPSGFLNSVDHALHQVESGLLHINRELSALADENSRFSRQMEPAAPQTRPITRDHEDISPTSRMDWTYDQNPDRVDRSSPPRLPPFEFSQLQRNVDWPSSRRNTLERRYEDEMPVQSLSSYLEHRQAQRDALPRPVRPSYTYEHSWRDSVVESRPNDVTPSSVAPSMPMRDRLLFRASAPNREPPNNAGRGRILRHPDSRDNSGSSLTQPAQSSTSFARLHRRRPPSPTTSDDPPPAPVSLSPPRSYASRFSHFLPRRSSGRGPAQSGANSDDNDEWIHPGSSGRMFFLRPRARTRTTSGGDFLRDDEFDDSYEGLLRLAARIGDAKPRGTPAEVIQAMPTGSYASCPGAKAETRCPICLDDYEQEDIVALIKGCSHWFHKECVQVDGEGSTEPQAGPSSNVSGNNWM